MHERFPNRNPEQAPPQPGRDHSGETGPDRIAGILQQLETGIEGILDDEGFARYLRVMARFPDYSPTNVALILIQQPEATKVAGYRMWQSLGRQVKKGETGIKIFVPFRRRVTRATDPGEGIGLVHGHFSPGWQSMSADDVVAERDRLASVVAGRTGRPLLGMTWGTDNAWSARLWVRRAARDYVRREAATVRVVGRRLRLTCHPTLLPPPTATNTQIATLSVWGEVNQADLAQLHLGIVGLGSVGSLVAETLARIGVRRITLIDHDHIEPRNLDRTLGATPEDADAGVAKVLVAARQVRASHTAETIVLEPFAGNVRQKEGLLRALDCDVLFSCVDRPAPRHLLNAIAYAHLIPVVDGGIIARVSDGKLLHVNWRIQTVGPGRSCLVCLGALRPEDVSLDMDGKLDDPVYIKGLGPQFDPLLARQNVFPFSLSVAAHEVLQMVGLVTGLEHIGGKGPQTYHGYPGMMEVEEKGTCAPRCPYAALTTQASDLSGNCIA